MSAVNNEMLVFFCFFPSSCLKKKVQIFICRKQQFKQETNIHITKIELRNFITEIL